MPLSICRPVDPSALYALFPDVPVPDPHKGSTVGRCYVCDQEVWVGPKQSEMAAERDPSSPVITVCLLCGVDYMKSVEAADGGPPYKIQALTDKEVPVRYADGTLGTLKDYER